MAHGRHRLGELNEFRNLKFEVKGVSDLIIAYRYFKKKHSCKWMKLNSQNNMQETERERESK